MTDDEKKEMLDTLRQHFLDFMQKIMSIPGSEMQKQQAYLRFGEGHMWLQNAIVAVEHVAEKVEPVVEAMAPIVEAVAPEVTPVVEAVETLAAPIAPQA